MSSLEKEMISHKDKMSTKQFKKREMRIQYVWKHSRNSDTLPCRIVLLNAQLVHTCALSLPTSQRRRLRYTEWWNSSHLDRESRQKHVNPHWATLNSIIMAFYHSKANDGGHAREPSPPGSAMPKEFKQKSPRVQERIILSANLKVS